MHEAIYMVVGACISGIVGIAISTYTRWRTQIADRNTLCQFIEVEINYNQNMIRFGLDTINKGFPEYPNNKEAALEPEETLKRISLYKDMYFQRYAFTELCDKLVLLKSEIIEYILTYYSSLQALELSMLREMAARHGVNDKQYHESRKAFKKHASITYEVGQSVLKHIRKERTSTKRFYIGRPKDK